MTASTHQTNVVLNAEFTAALQKSPSVGGWKNGSPADAGRLAAVAIAAPQRRSGRPGWAAAP